MRQWQPLAHKMAYHYARRDEFDEVKSKTQNALFYAARSFDPNRKAQFSTWYMWWVKGAFSRVPNEKQMAFKKAQHVQIDSFDDSHDADNHSLAIGGADRFKMDAFTETSMPDSRLHKQVEHDLSPIAVSVYLHLRKKKTYNDQHEWKARACAYTLVAYHQDELTLNEIGRNLKVSREWVRKILMLAEETVKRLTTNGQPHRTDGDEYLPYITARAAVSARQLAGSPCGRPPKSQTQPTTAPPREVVMEIECPM